MASEMLRMMPLGFFKRSVLLWKPQLKRLKKGAYDYIAKPFKLEKMKVAVQNVCEKIQFVRKNQGLLNSLT